MTRRGGAGNGRRGPLRGIGAGAPASAAPSYPLPTGGLIAQWEARATGLDANGQIETWDDASGNGNALTCPASLGGRIVVASSALYGDTTVAQFTGGAVGTNRLVRRATFTQGAQAQPTCRVFIGDRPNLVTGSQRTILDGGGASNRQVLYRFDNANGGWTTAALTNLKSNDNRATPMISFEILAGPNSLHYLDDVATPVSVGTATEPSTNGLNGTTIGGAYSATFGDTFSCWGVYVFAAASVSDFSESWRRAVAAYVYAETAGAVGTAP